MKPTDYIRRRRARNAHWDAGMTGSRILNQLWTVNDTTTRADLLYNLGDTMTIRADLHPLAWNNDAAAVSLKASSVLVRLVACTERQLHPETRFGALEVWLDNASPAETAAWQNLATVHDRAARADLLEQIYEHAAQRYDRPAAEVLLTLARTERELADAKAEGRAPSMPADPLRPLRHTIAAALLTGAAAAWLPDLISLIH